MKLKSIMYSLGYGKSEKALIRSEGARRVVQAKSLLKERVAMKSLLFPSRYGCSSKQLKQTLIFEGDYDTIKHFTDINNNSIDNLTWCGSIH